MSADMAYIIKAHCLSINFSLSFKQWQSFNCLFSNLSNYCLYIAWWIFLQLFVGTTDKCLLLLYFDYLAHVWYMRMQTYAFHRYTWVLPKESWSLLVKFPCWIILVIVCLIDFWPFCMVCWAAISQVGWSPSPSLSQHTNLFEIFLHLIVKWQRVCRLVLDDTFDYYGEKCLLI